MPGSLSGKQRLLGFRGPPGRDQQEHGDVIRRIAQRREERLLIEPNAVRIRHLSVYTQRRLRSSDKVKRMAPAALHLCREELLQLASRDGTIALAHAFASQPDRIFARTVSA